MAVDSRRAAGPLFCRLSTTAAIFAGVFAAATVNADEDWRKLKTLQPPYLGPGITGANIPATSLPGYQGGPAPRGGFNMQGMILHSWLPSSAFGAPQNFADCTGYTSPAGREYAILGSYLGTHFVEITDPVNPVIVGFVAGPNSLWRDTEVKNGYAYSVSEGGSGVQVIDIRNIDAATNRIRFVANRTPNGYTTTHTILTNPATPFLYICGSNINSARSVAVLSVEADPENPVFVGQWQEPSARYAHEAQIISYTSGPFAGREICYSYYIYGSGGLDILDVTDKSNIFRVSIGGYTQQRGTHQGWITPDLRYMYIDDELDEDVGVMPSLTRVMDVSDITNPVHVGSFATGSTSKDHNQYVRGNFLFQSNYEGGLHVYDISNPVAPTHIAFFDSYPDGESAAYNGDWGNYPFFPSGRIIIGDMQRGLFVLSLDPNSVSFSTPAALPTQVVPASPTPVSIQIQATGSPIEADQVTMFVSVDDAAYAPIQMTPAGDGQFTATLPAAPCQSTISYYFSASNQAGTLYSFPAGAPMADHFTATSLVGVSTLATNTMETTAGWARNATDTATTGLWERGNPDATSAQPGDDHTPGSGDNCWVTGRAAGSGDGANDIDGGRTTLISAPYDLSAADPATTRIGYWRWYNNSAGSGANNDVFTVQTSNNGTEWTTVEAVGPTGEGTSGGWIYHEFLVSDFVPLSSTVRVRFIAEDFDVASLVEAAVDDFQIIEIDCGVPCPADWDGSGSITSQDFFDFVAAFFAGDADFNHTGGTNSQDFFDFIAAFFDPPAECN